MILDTFTYSITVVATVLTFVILYLYWTGNKSIK